MNFRKRVARGLALNSSLGRSITFCMVALLVAGIATSTWTLTRSWQKEVADAERDAINLSVSQARQAEDTFLQAEMALRDIRRNLPATGINDINNHQFNNYLSELQQHLPQLHGFMVYDPLGNMIATSFGKISPLSNNSDREYFLYHRRNAHGSIHIGHVIRSRSTGDLVIPVSLRISDSAGGFAGVLLATVKLDYFRHFYSYFELQNRDLLALLNTDGNTLYVRPFADDVINRNLSASPLFTQELEKKDRGNGTWVSALDHVERIYGFARLERYPLVVAAGYDKPALWATWLKESLPDLVLNAMLLLGTLLMGAIIFRQVRMNVRNQNELAELRDELTSINHTLQLMALADGLTGLANRRQFDLFLAKSLKASALKQKPVSLIMIDIDYFKRYNDYYGHVAGDDCLRTVGEILQKLRLNTHDLIARYGGEEFAIILPDTGPEAALFVARQAVNIVRGAQIPHEQTGGAQGTLTISAGCYSIIAELNADEAQRLKEGADKALYQAKVQGRNRAIAANEALLQQP
ncbi:GGDEF domain-containing protein [Kosakonia sp. MUSA4]|uniref:GGDEF domain-containing protein n=1 Tax=Kosakonia sp. MUSA4 TaxID=2067958 RepID=UPI0008C2935C|nr:GGDEF domain-containing protein [Kosakonia sp. MUSA4]QJT80734.1 GGDEF domain-containing protein [Kosakonia sp. MUSA4]SEK97431.1 diguanylate cyclase (GGDEF) domain-containing protein [Kosakonia sacchari]